MNNETNETTTSEAASEKSGRVFTQEQVNTLLAEQKRRQAEKFADYDELKAKAAQFDDATQAAKSDLERAIERAEKAEQAVQDANTRLAERDHQILVAEVAAEKQVPAGHLTGSTREELVASADALLAWRAEQVPQVRKGPFTPRSGSGSSTRASGVQAGREKRRGQQKTT